MTCKGIFYRISVDQFQSHRGFSTKVRARLLKSESCTGCQECEEIHRRIALIGNGAWIDNLQEKKHGEKCRLRLKDKI